MTNLEKVESAFRHGDAIVVYDEGNDAIWVCYGKCRSIWNGKGIKFFDCSLADVEDDVEYCGEVFDDSYNLVFRVPEGYEDHCPFVPTRFVEGEFVKANKRRT